MLIRPIEQERLLQVAQTAFPDSYIQIEESDIFLKGKTAGRYRAPWLDHEFYVSTEYAYEDILINGNQTRYKVHMTCILLKPGEYEVVYDSKDCFYVAYEEDHEIKFIKYVELIQQLPQQMELLEELVPV